MDGTFLICKHCYDKILFIIDDHSKLLDMKRTNEISNIEGRYLEGGMSACFEIKQKILALKLEAK